MVVLLLFMLIENYQRSQKIARYRRYFVESKHSITTKKRKRYDCVYFSINFISV